MLNRYLEKAQFTGMREMKMKTIMRKQCPLYTQKIGKIGMLGDTKGWRGHGEMVTHTLLVGDWIGIAILETHLVVIIEIKYV